MQEQINGTELFYEIEGSGPPLVLLHGGMGLDHTYFRPWFGSLGDVAEVIFYDHRGNGRSAEPKDWSAVDHETWLSDLDCLRERLGHEKVVLFGHSYGGFLAQQYALSYPDRLKGLILCSTAPALDYADLILLNAEDRAEPHELEVLGRALSGPAANDEEVENLWRGILPLYFHQSEPDLFERSAARIVYRAGAWNRSLFELGPSFNTLDQLNQVRMPTLVLGGRDDWIMPPKKGSERIHFSVPGSEMVIFEESGHFPWIEEEDAFFDAVRDWLIRLDAGFLSS